MTGDFKTLLAAARLPERTVAVCLRGDLVAEFEDVDRRLQALQGKPSDSLAGNGQAELVEQLEALQQQMREHTYPFRLRALPKHQFQRLLADHPPRRDEAGELVAVDAAIGVNTETMFTALIRACLVDPQLDDVQWADLDGKLTDRQYADLSDAAWYLNRGEVSIPFSLIASQMRRNTEPA